MGNSQEMNCSVQKQNILEEKNDLISGHLLTDQEKSRTSENPVLDENAQGKSELPSKCEIGELMEARSAGSNADQMVNLYVVELGSDDVQCEPVETEAVGSEQLEGKPIETTIIGSVSIDVSLSSMVILGSVAQNCTMGSSIMESNTSDEKLKTDEHVSSEHFGTRMVASDAENSHICVTEENNPEGEPENDSKLVHDEAIETSTAECGAQKIQTMELHSEQQKVTTENKTVGLYSVDTELSGSPPTCAAKNSDCTGYKEGTASSKSKKRKSMLNCTSATVRALRPRVNGLCKTPEPISDSANANVSGEREKRKKKRKKAINALDDEFSRTRKRLRYFLSRMGYEHNFIEAYSGEGWKGQSVEKIRPVKELERAASQILQCKRRIRELFQHLDSSCSEGRFHESLFDDEGLIDSDDIFCAKCGSKELSADNDIILCDGTCDRGFHQMCLKPPLLKEDIPPGDEGWLCPRCDCKLDCIDLLNDSQGTYLSVDHAWE